MPSVFRHGAFRAFFYSNEGNPREPMHVHVRRGDAEAKLWLETGQVTVAMSHGFDARTLGDRAVRFGPPCGDRRGLA